MTIGSGLGGSVGIGRETTFGTPATPTRWLEMDSEGLKWRPVRYQGHGLAAGVMVAKQSQRVTTNADAGGPIKSMVYSKGMGLWISNLMGSTATPQQQSSTAAYKQTHPLGIQTGIFDTIQAGVPDTGGTVHPYTFEGSKITEAQFECDQAAPLTATFTVDSKDCSESPSLTAPAFLSANPEHHFGEWSFEMGSFGSEAVVEGVRKMSVSIKRAVADKRFYADGTGRKAEQIGNGIVEISGSLDVDFIDKTVFADRFVTDASQSVIFSFVGPQIGTTGFFNTFAINLSDIHLDAETPSIDGPDIISPKVTFSGLYDENNAPATITIISTDTAL
jgi:hypothetical protein